MLQQLVNQLYPKLLRTNGQTMQYTTISSPGKALVSDNSISILNFSCICILPLKNKSVEPIYRGIDLGVAHYLLIKQQTPKLISTFSFFIYCIQYIYS